MSKKAFIRHTVCYIIGAEVNVMNKEKDISIIEWHPLPAPADRYLIVRFHDDGELCSEMAFSVDGTEFLDDMGQPFYAPIEAWAYFPYDGAIL